MSDEVRWDCVVRLNFRGISQEEMKHFISEIAAVGKHWKAEECLVEIPEHQISPPPPEVEP